MYLSAEAMSSSSSARKISDRKGRGGEKKEGEGKEEGKGVIV